MTTNQLSYETVDFGEHPEYCIIWLHGLGADGHDFVPIVKELNLPLNLNVRFIFPHAPHQPVTINGGITMRAWFDIKQANVLQDIDIAGIQRSVSLVEQIIEQQSNHGLQPQHTIIAGFSQGGTIALQLGIQYPARLAGILALSTYWRPLVEQYQSNQSCANQTTPIFMAHGLYDPIVPLTAAQQTYQQLQRLQFNVDFKTYPMIHQVCPAELDDIQTWLMTTLQSS